MIFQGDWIPPPDGIGVPPFYQTLIANPVRSRIVHFRPWFGGRWGLFRGIGVIYRRGYFPSPEELEFKAREFYHLYENELLYEFDFRSC